MFTLLDPKQRRSARILIVLMFFGMALEMLGIGLVGPFIVLLVQPDPLATVPEVFQGIVGALKHVPYDQIVIFALFILISVYGLKSIFLTLLAWRRTRFAFGLQAEFSKRLFITYITQPYSFHLQRNSAQLIRNASSELTIWTGNVVIPTLMLIAEGMVTLGICILLVILEPFATIIIICALSLLIGVFIRLLQKPISKWGLQRQYHEGLRIQHLQQSLGSIKEVKLLGREDDFIDQFHKNVFASARASQRQTFFQTIPGFWIEFFGVLGLVLLVFSMLSFGRTFETILPTLGLFGAAAFRLMPSANRIVGAIQQLRFGIPVSDMLQRELILQVKLNTGREKHQNLSYNKTLLVDNITFTYDNVSAPAIFDVSLKISPGESIGIFGPSGSGKSTLIDLLLGLIVPQKGTISVDGKNIQFCMRRWQNLVGYVPQNIYLIDDTVARNIALGIPENEIDYESVKAAVKAAQLEKWTASLPDGLETVVGERGVRLSGGQRQRVGIARALYHNPKVLVLDEATSALDSATENDVIASVAALKGKKTLIMIAHRTSTLTNCDRVYRLECGRITQTTLP